jgi:hypothetical protein
MERRSCLCGGYSTLTSHLLNKINVNARIAISLRHKHAIVVVFINNKKYYIEPQDQKNIFYEA